MQLVWLRGQSLARFYCPLTSLPQSQQVLAAPPALQPSPAPGPLHQPSALSTVLVDFISCSFSISSLQNLSSMGAGTPSVQHIHASQASRIALGTQQELNRHLLNKDLNDDPCSEFACRGGQSGHSLCYVQPPLALQGSQDLEPLTLSHPSGWKALG